MQVDTLRKKMEFYNSTDENKELLKKNTNVWNGIKNEIKSII